MRGWYIIILPSVCVLTGCAAIAPLTSVITPPSNESPPLQVHEQTRVDLEKDNFILVKTNAWGHSDGFSLLGFITIVPPTLNKALQRMYATAEMRPGSPQSVAHLVIEKSTSYFILFGIPKVQVRADIVQFRPEVGIGEKPVAENQPP